MSSKTAMVFILKFKWEPPCTYKVARVIVFPLKLLKKHFKYWNFPVRAIIHAAFVN